MIAVVAVGPNDRQVVCETRWLAAATATAVAMSTRSARCFRIVDDDGAVLGHALGGVLLDAFGEPIEVPPTLWN